jgi:hypothetical protein
MTRVRTPTAVETEVLVRSRRSCALCFGLNLQTGPVRGQIAHVDRDSSRTGFDDLCWLCLQHHDEYDSKPSQSKGFTPHELRRYRTELYAFLDQVRNQLVAASQPTMSPEAVTVAQFLNAKSQSGRKLDCMTRIDSLKHEIPLAHDDVDIAIDELQSGGLVELNGTRDSVFATDQFFWESDPLFRDTDPATDAGVVARKLLTLQKDQIDMPELADRLGWDARRLNPATTYLAAAGYATGTPGIANQFWTSTLWRTVSTKRFVRDLDAARSHLE